MPKTKVNMFMLIIIILCAIIKQVTIQFTVIYKASHDHHSYICLIFKRQVHQPAEEEESSHSRPKRRSNIGQLLFTYVGESV